jgi:hypothetical protein
MAYYNGFPATYNQMYPQGYPGAQMPMYGQQMPNNGYMGGTFQNGNTQPVPGAQMSGANQAAPMMTPPTIRAEIIQLEDEAAVDRFPLAAGASQMFMTRAEDKIIIKTMGQDGALPLVIYDKRPPAPPAPKFDPAEYVRRDEADKLIMERVETLVSAALTAQKASQRKQAQEVE